MLFLNFNSFSQDQLKADSAIRVLESEDLSDKQRLQVLERISGHITNPDSKIYYSKKLVDEAESLGNYKFLLLGYFRLGAGYKNKGDLSKALEIFLKAAKLASENNDPVAEGDAYTNVATVYTSNEDYEKALDYYDRVLGLYENEVDSARLAGVYINYGYAAYKASQYDSAIAILEKALYFAQFASYNGYMAYAQSNMALSLAKTGRFDEAEKKLNEAMKIMESNKDNYGLSDCLIEIGGVYIEEGELNTAINKLERGYKIAVETGLKQQIQNGAKYLSKAYEQKGDLTKALDYQSKYYTYRDSLINAEQIRKLADLRTTYEVGQKQAEVDLLTAEKRTQQIIIFSTAGGALLVAILLGLVYKNYRDKNRINKILENQKEQLESLNQTKDKFFSIISHDLRGPVSAFSGITRLIKYAVEDKNYDELNEITGHIDDTVQHLSSLLDNLLSWAMQQQGHFPNVPEKISLKEMADEIQGIFSNMATAKNIELTTEVDDVSVWADKNTSMTILRNLVNNALKFTPKNGEVAVSAKQQGDFAQITVTDTGVGMNADKIKELFQLQGKKSEYGTAGEKGLGLGLQLVYEFVEMNKGTIEVDSKEGKGTVFTVKLPLFESVAPLSTAHN